jgi:hypothetical protein
MALTGTSKSPILRPMKAVAWNTIFSLLFLSIHVAVDHASVPMASRDGAPFCAHFHSESEEHSHSNAGHHHPASGSDSTPTPSSHDPSDHGHDGTLLRGSSASGTSVGLSFACLKPLQEALSVEWLLTTFTPTFDVNPPPPTGKTFLSKQSLLI